MNTLPFLLSCFFLLFSSYAQSGPNIEDYGQLPKFRSMAISPDGKHFSYISRGPDNDFFVIRNTKTTDMVFGANVDKFKARSTEFLTNKHVLLKGSKTGQTFGYRGRREYSGGVLYNLETKEFEVLLKGIKDIHPAQTGLGYIVGLNVKEEVVYMPAYARGQDPKYHLYRVNLKNGKGRIHAKGNHDTIDWFVGEDGKILAREEYDKSTEKHIIRSKIDGEWNIVYEMMTKEPLISVRAVGIDGESLLFVDSADDNEAIYSMSLHDGGVAGPVFFREKTDIDQLVLDVNRKLKTVIYSGFKPSYDFLDLSFEDVLIGVENSFPTSSVYFESWSDNKNEVVVRVAGGDAAGVYYLFNRGEKSLTRIASQYEVSGIGEIKAIRYTARDGLKIPALLTLPVDSKQIKNLPLIVFPHGGPGSYDQIDFNWKAQYFSAKGYAVLQPNFRGSTGFGYAFRDAGAGRWGREMQDDVSDGVAILVASGYVDPDRVCIIGSSYGGYSSLAGGAFTPELYRCVVSINGVSDLPYMLKSVKRKYGKNHWVLDYWSRIIGNSKTELEKLKEISPVNFSSNFKAPVLIIHGKDDTVVPIEQSKRMYKALKKSGATVEFVALKGEDHWLSTSVSRLETLKLIDNFLDRYNPVAVNDDHKPLREVTQK